MQPSTHPVWEGSEKFYLVKVFQKPRSTQSAVVETWQYVHHVTRLHGVSGPTDLLAGRTPHIISAVRCGSALFGAKVLRVWGPCVLRSRLPVSQASVRNVSWDLLPMLSISHCL